MALFAKKQSDMPRRRQGVRHERATEESLVERYAFQRNRTLTGSVSPKIVSTSESNAQLKSPRVQAHELVHKRRRIGLALLVVAMIASVFFALVYQFTAGVTVKARDASMELDPVYERVIQEYLSRKPIERIRAALNEEQLTTYLQAAAPEVAQARTEGPAGFGVSAFVLTFREPVAGWSVGGEQQYVDGTGTAFSRNYFATPKVQISDNSGIPAEAGPVASNRFLGFVGRVVGIAKEQGYSVKEVVVPVGTTRQIEVIIEGVPYPAKLSVDRAAGEQVEDMIRSIKWLTGRGVTPAYLDVRVSGKAFYK